MFHETASRLKLAVLFQILLDIVIFLLSVRGETCSVMVRATAGDDLTTLRDKTFAAFRKECRLNKDQLNVSKSCSFTTEPAELETLKFILQPLNVPFRLDFAVKTEKSARVVLAENTTHGSIFAYMNIGGKGNIRASMKSCYYLECSDAVARHEETGLVNATEYRPFWIDYQGGVVTVGKGGKEEAFLEWDAGAHHGRVATQVRIGIASPRYADWMFYKFCEWDS